VTKSNRFSSQEEESNWLITLLRNLRLAWHLLRDPLVPLWSKLIPFTALVYILLPADLIPDVIIGLGQMDDVAIVLLSLKLFIASCPPEIVQRHLAKMSSVNVSYRVVEEDEPRTIDVAGYLDAESHVPSSLDEVKGERGLPVDSHPERDVAK